MVSNQFVHHTLRDLPDFRGCWACDQISKISFDSSRRHQIIVNTGLSSSDGEHFIYLELQVKGNPIFVDSFGTCIENEYITKFLIDRGYKQYSFSRQQIQSPASVYCGFFCIYTALCRAKKYSIEKILSKFSQVNLTSNDALCVKLIEEGV